jgi:hypothetical protein
VREKYCWLVADKPSEQGESTWARWVHWVFLKNSWNIIKEDVMSAFQFFFQQHDQHLMCSSQRNLTLSKSMTSAL